MNTQDQKIANMSFSSIYPLYLTKIEKKGRTEDELQKIIQWLTGYNREKQQYFLEKNSSYQEFFEHAIIPESTKYITGSICGVKIQEIENPLTKKVRYLDKLVDELAKGKELKKIIRS